MYRRVGLFCSLLLFIGCGDDGGSGTCEVELAFEHGGDGHAEPLAAGSGEARAGRLSAAQLPESPGGLQRFAAGDFVLANDRVAMIIEDVGPSDLYDPWGGRPLGVMKVDGGQLVDVAEFGEFFILAGRFTVVTDTVSVIADGSDGGPAIVRASGTMAPLPFFDNIVGGLLRDDLEGLHAAIDYELAPGAEHVDIFVTFRSPVDRPTVVNTVLHGFMYLPRMPAFAPGLGFDVDGKRVPYLGFIGEQGVSYAYSLEGEDLDGGVSASGFSSNFSDGFEIGACGDTRRQHARLTIGGPDVDGLRQAIARREGGTLREVTGTVKNADGSAAAGVRVHAVDADDRYVTRARTDESGAFALHLDGDGAHTLTAFRRGDAVVTHELAAGTASADLVLQPHGFIHVTAEDADSGAALPVRVQVLPSGGSAPAVPNQFGEPAIPGGRTHVAYPADGDVTLRVPAGDHEVVVSRGYEYEIHEETVTVASGATEEVGAVLTRVVDTTGLMCADYHIHTHRSADSGDDAREKLLSAAADGLDIPIRSEHEYVEDFQPLIDELGLADWMFGMASVEMTSMEIWGHMGVLPLEPDDSAVNGGTPLWQRFPSAENPDVFVETLSPPDVFAAVRQRPEEPIIIINHPRGNTNYFGYAGYDPTTGMVSFPEVWDEDFKVVEVFNDSSWPTNLGGVVEDWLSFLNNGRRVFAVGSSDSHGISSSPVGYPRTCLELGTDDPRAVTPNMVRDATAAGHSTISGGVYVEASVGNAGPGDDVVGAPSTVMVDVRVQAADWVDVDWIDVVVDGAVHETIAILPGDADPMNPTVRFDAQVAVPVSGAMGSYVIIAAYGDSNLDPVHPGRRPFGVTNPIFLIP